MNLGSYFFWHGGGLRVEMDNETKIIEVCDALTAIGAACGGIVFGENICNELATLQRHGWHLTFELAQDGFVCTGRPGS